MAPAFQGCLYPGSRTRRIEAWLVDINDKPEQDWRLLCESTPFTWNRVTYSSPTHCEARVSVTPAHVPRHPHIRTNRWCSVVRDEIRNVGHFRRQLLTSSTGSGGWGVGLSKLTISGANHFGMYLMFSLRGGTARYRILNFVVLSPSEKPRTGL